MIQGARSSSSQSLLREAESLEILIENEDVKQYLKTKLKDVIEARRNPERTYTGAKALKDDLLAYLQQQGIIKTANVWCRKLRLLKSSELIQNIKNKLKSFNIQGVVELHLQDREINSPHIQFVGNNAEKAEELIANEILKMGFEDSFQSAVSRNKAPAYMENISIRVIKYDDEIKDVKELAKTQEKYKERTEFLKEKLESIRNKKLEFLEILDIKKEKVTNYVNNVVETSRTTRNMRITEILNNDTDSLFEKWKENYTKNRRAK